MIPILSRVAELGSEKRGLALCEVWHYFHCLFFRSTASDWSGAILNCTSIASERGYARRQDGGVSSKNSISRDITREQCKDGIAGGGSASSVICAGWSPGS